MPPRPVAPIPEIPAAVRAVRDACVAAIIYDQMRGNIRKPKTAKERGAPRAFVAAIVQGYADGLHTLGTPDLDPVISALATAGPGCWSAKNPFEATRVYLIRQEEAALVTLAARVQTLAPAWQAKFWRREGEIGAWFHGPPNRTSTGAAALEALQQDLLEHLVLNGGLSAARARAVTRTWPNAAADIASGVAYAWTEAWKNRPAAAGVAGASPTEGMSAARAAHWARFVTEVLATTPAGRDPEEARQAAQWRKVILEHLDDLQDDVPEVQQMIEDRCQQERDHAGVLAVDLLQNIPWIRDPARRPPSLDEIRRLVARLPMQVLADDDGEAEALTEFLQAMVCHPAVAHTAMLALWAQWPAYRMQLLENVVRLGESWWTDRTFVNGVGAMLVTHPFNKEIAYDRILKRTMGLMDADQWIAVVAYVTTQGLVMGPAILNGMAQFPAWQPSAEGLQPLFLHRDARLREWAQLALAGPLAPNIPPNTETRPTRGRRQ